MPSTEPTSPALTLTLLPDVFTIHRLAPGAPAPPLPDGLTFSSVSRTPDELSLVAPSDVVVHSDRSEIGWRCFKIEGVLDFGMVGVVAGVSGALAGAGVSLFVVSTFNTDYLLVKQECVNDAIEALRELKHTVENAST